jgi:two-component system sensor histidine kinase RegB
MHVTCHAEGDNAGAEPRLSRRPELIYGLGNIIENAAEFATAHVWLNATYSADEIRIRISDDGPGFSSDILAHLGEPYTSSRRQSGTRRREVTNNNQEFGLGLGYFIARTLLQRSRGQINAFNLRPSETAERAEELRKTGAEPSVSRTGACVEIVWPRAALEQGD